MPTAKYIARLALLSCTLVLSACADESEGVSGKLESFVSKNKVGGGADVWLIKHNAFGEYEKVSLVFGFMDDYAFCAEIADLYNRKHPDAGMSCGFANH